MLSRRPGETIIIETPAGECIAVAVLGVEGNQVRSGTAVVAEVTILRDALAGDATH